MAITTETRDDMLNHFFRNGPVYVGIFTSSGEVDGNGYERVEVTFLAPSNGTIKNESEIRFPIAMEEWGEITEAGVFDDEEGGKRLEQGYATNVKLVRENDRYSIPAETYEISLDKDD